MSTQPDRATTTPPLAGIGDEAAAGLTEQVDALLRLEWSRIELRTVDGMALADLTAEHFERLVRTLREAGLSVLCLASRIGNWARPITSDFDEDLRELNILVERCHALDTRFIRIMSYPNNGLSESAWRDRVLDRIALLTERAAAGGVTLLHENCSGWAGASAERMLTLLNHVDNPALRLLFDTGNGVPHGYDGYEMLRRIIGHVAHVHVKDALWKPDNTTYVLPGDGQARVADCLRLLLASGYTGAFSLEPHLAARPHEGLVARDSGEWFVRAGTRLERLLNHTMLTPRPRSTATVAEC